MKKKSFKVKEEDFIIHIAVDSTLLRQDRALSKKDLLYLKELGKLNLIKIHIPYFVYKECTTHSVQDINASLTKAISSITNLDRLGLQINLTKELNKISEQLKLKQIEISSSVELLWNDYIRDSNAILHEFDSADSIKVFDNYFSGGKPFSSLKSRKDIPDAFIFQTLKKIAQEHTIHFLSEDNNFHEVCKDEKNILVYQNFEDLFKSSHFKPVIVGHKKLKSYEASKVILMKRLPEIKKVVKEWFYHKFEQQEVESHFIPSDNNDGTITGVEEIVDITLLTDEIKFIDGDFYLDIEVTADCLVDYYIFKSEYYILDEERRIHTEDWNDHYFLAEEAMRAMFKFEVKIPRSDLDDDLDLDIEIEEMDTIEIIK